MANKYITGDTDQGVEKCSNPNPLDNSFQDPLVQMHMEGVMKYPVSQTMSKIH